MRSNYDWPRTALTHSSVVSWFTPVCILFLYLLYFFISFLCHSSHLSNWSPVPSLLHMTWSHYLKIFVGTLIAGITHGLSKIDLVFAFKHYVKFSSSWLSFLSRLSRVTVFITSFLSLDTNLFTFKLFVWNLKQHARCSSQTSLRFFQ